MSQATSPSTGGRYGLARVFRAWEGPRSTRDVWKAQEGRDTQPSAPRGPNSLWTAAVLIEQVRLVLVGLPFLGEGYRKVWAGCAWPACAPRGRGCRSPLDRARTARRRAQARMSSGTPLVTSRSVT